MNSPLTLTERCLEPADIPIALTLELTAWERTRSRYQTQTPEGEEIALRLPRGTILHEGDIVQTQARDKAVRIVAKPEPVLEVTASSAIALLRAAYHLGNRHVAVELTPHYLRLEVDPVLKAMLEQLGLEVTEKCVPFHPETGAYHHQH